MVKSGLRSLGYGYLKKLQGCVEDKLIVKFQIKKLTKTTIPISSKSDNQNQSYKNFTSPLFYTILKSD